MNEIKKKTILEIIHKFILREININEYENLLKGATTQLQNATFDDVVFYRIREDQKAKDDFNKRKEGKKIGLFILCGADDLPGIDNAILVEEKNFIKVQKIVCDLFYPNQSKMKLVGVTGTNGKTTTVNLAMQVSTLIGHPAISLGTIGLHDTRGPVGPDLESTTPSYVELRKIIFQFQDKYEALFMEVSSHALAQERLWDLRLDLAAWTSFSQDHLDYHKSMEEYFTTKALIASKYLNENGVLIMPKAEAVLFARVLKAKKKKSFVCGFAKTLNERGMSNLPLFYRSTYNQSNMELALELNEQLWKSTNLTKLDINEIKTPAGRFSIFEIEKNKLAVVDYAHTPDALINIGQAIKAAFPQFRQTVIFGCGGNRDRKKRPVMGAAVDSFAYKIVVTTDNPRDESPEDIAADAVAGIKNSYEIILDRKDAILNTLEKIQDFEIVLIAGKGHECYQEIKGVKYPFSDIELVEEFIRSKKVK